jgi:hypothetical protein
MLLIIRLCLPEGQEVLFKSEHTTNVHRVFLELTLISEHGYDVKIK